MSYTLHDQLLTPLLLLINNLTFYEYLIPHASSPITILRIASPTCVLIVRQLSLSNDDTVFLNLDTKLLIASPNNIHNFQTTLPII